MSSTTRGKPWINPTRLVVLSFLAIILAGTFLLMLPWATSSGGSPRLIDALFTATSATCVTGLIVVNTAAYWSLFGKIVIIALIQAGGLGLMAFSTAHALVTGRRIGLWERMVIQEQTGQWNLSGLVRLMRRILIATLVFELTGALLLAVGFICAEGFPVIKALWFGLFHSISAFCNAGFDITGNSLVNYVANPLIILTISFLIIFGGLGFHVVIDLYAQKCNWKALSLHSRTAIKVTIVLLVAGTLLVFFLERDNSVTLAPLTPEDKILGAFFQAVTPRTAGFNSIAQDGMRVSTCLVTIVLMFIGASPGGTGGGIKTTTFYTLVRYVRAIIRGEDDVTLGKRRIPGTVVNRAIAVFLLSAGLILVDTFILTLTENASFLDILFEVTSAFGTVGLSRGITPSLSSIGKMVLILTMFAGRVGPLSLAMALSRQGRASEIRYPEGKISVG